jgi:hypothetical protein
MHFWSGCRRVARNLPQNRKTLTPKNVRRHPPLYADIDVGTSDDEGGNPKVAAVPHPSEDEEDEGDAYHEEDYHECFKNLSLDGPSQPCLSKVGSSYGVLPKHKRYKASS